MKGKCKVCGEIEIDYHFEGNDGEMSVPVALCPTIQSLGKYIKHFSGVSYKKNTGNSLQKSFKKKFITPSHKSYDDDSYEECKRHTLEPIECWCEII